MTLGNLHLTVNIILMCRYVLEMLFQNFQHKATLLVNNNSSKVTLPHGSRKY